MGPEVLIRKEPSGCHSNSDDLGYGPPLKTEKGGGGVGEGREAGSGADGQGERLERRRSLFCPETGRVIELGESPFPSRRSSLGFLAVL